MWVVKGKTIGVLGLAFKPDTDDMRFAPSIDIIKALQKEGAKIRAFDPEAEESAKKILKNVEYAEEPYGAIKDADALVIVTEWSEFRVPKYKVMSKLMKNRVVFDGRNIYEPELMKDEGFEYYGVGRR